MPQTKSYPKPVVGWLVNTPNVKNPVEIKKRILIFDARIVNGKVVEATFTMNRKPHSLETNGTVVELKNSRIVMGHAEIRLSDSQRKREYVEGLCRMACDPSTETYWSL